jgi:hypothetical protein
MATDRQELARGLSSDLLDDVELSRIGAEALLLKAVRLARLLDDAISLEWLELELHGYESFSVALRPHLARSCRITNNNGKEAAYLMSLGSVVASIGAQEARITATKSPSLSGEFLGIALDRIHGQVNQATLSVIGLAQVKSAVLARIHEFAARTFQELTFSESQEELFGTARREIDAMLAPLSAKALEKIESITERLAREEVEAISQAMNTCRRLIDQFADAVYPAQAEPAIVDGQAVERNKSKVLNRIDLFVRSATESTSRQQRLRRSLRDIYERVSAGVHGDVTPSEARFLFLHTYIILGEILTLRNAQMSVAAGSSEATSG